MTTTTTNPRCGPPFGDGTRGLAIGDRLAETGKAEQGEDGRDLLGRIAVAEAWLAAARRPGVEVAFFGQHPPGAAA